jgi:hypothetical protein
MSHNELLVDLQINSHREDGEKCVGSQARGQEKHRGQRDDPQEVMGDANYSKSKTSNPSLIVVLQSSRCQMAAVFVLNGRERYDCLCVRREC